MRQPAAHPEPTTVNAFLNHNISTAPDLSPLGCTAHPKNSPHTAKEQGCLRYTVCFYQHLEDAIQQLVNSPGHSPHQAPGNNPSAACNPSISSSIHVIRTPFRSMACMIHCLVSGGTDTTLSSVDLYCTQQGSIGLA